MDKREKITADTTIEEVVTRYPKTVSLFYKHGLSPIACGEPVWGTIRENAEQKGISARDLEALLQELNALIEKAGC